MKTNNIRFRILQNPEHHLNNGESDIAAEIGYNKSQVAEYDAVNSAIKQVNEDLPDGLCARIADSEQCVLTKGDRAWIQVGIDLFTKN
jgi:hypothetical protein